MAEENEAKETLAKLEKLKAGEPEFDELFARFAGDVLTHASNEEAEEFPRLRQQMSEKALATMGSLLEKAEKLAPTHPHPSARSTTANVVLGPFATMVDKVKDSVSGLRS